MLLEEQITKKGNMGYINLFSNLKNQDFDRDGLLYNKEWQKCLEEQRISLNEIQQKSLFDHFSINLY